MRTDIEEYKPMPDIIGGLQEEETVWLDRGCCNEQLVTIIAFNKRQCLVQDRQGQRYAVIGMRLSKP